VATAKNCPSAASTTIGPNQGSKSPPLRVQQNGAPVSDKKGTSAIKRKASAMISNTAGSDDYASRAINTEFSTSSAATLMVAQRNLLATGTNSQGI
jgi:hypothetical protein